MKTTAILLLCLSAAFAADQPKSKPSPKPYACVAGPEEVCASDLWYADWLKLTQLQSEIKALQERDKIIDKNDQATGMAFRLQQQIPVGYKWDEKKLRFVKIPTPPPAASVPPQHYENNATPAK